MKKLLAAIILLSPLTANAGDDLCTSVSKLARTVMDVRQDGMDMAVVMGVFTAEETNGDMGKKMVIKAYKSPRYSTTKMQERAIEDFANDWYLACVTAG